MFTFRAYGWQGKAKKTFHDTGKLNIAKESDVWRIVHRQEFEQSRTVEEIHPGMVVRVKLKDDLSDFTGMVQTMQDQGVMILLTAELEKDASRRFTFSEVESIVEIMSFPLFYRLRRATGGEQVGGKNLF